METSDVRNLTVREGILKLVHSRYHVSMEDIAEALGIRFQDDRLHLEDLTHQSLDQLHAAALTCISFIEFVSTRKATVEAVKGREEANHGKTRSEKRLEYMREHEFKRGSKGEAEVVAEADPEVLAHAEKVAAYDAYARYLYNVIKCLELIHYSCKSLINTMDKGPMRGHSM